LWTVGGDGKLVEVFQRKIAIRTLNAREPVLIPGEGWPDGTVTNRTPDFQWRAKPLFDERPDSERPESAKVDPFNPENTDVTPNLDGYRQVLVRHAKQLTQLLNSRHILFANNIGTTGHVTVKDTGTVKAMRLSGRQGTGDLTITRCNLLQMLQPRERNSIIPDQ